MQSQAAGWAEPELEGWRAILLHMKGDTAGARTAFRQAVDAGWRHYYTVARFPPVLELFEDAELSSAVARVTEDIERMSARVVDLESLPPRRPAVARVDARPDTSNNN